MIVTLQIHQLTLSFLLCLYNHCSLQTAWPSSWWPFFFPLYSHQGTPWWWHSGIPLLLCSSIRITGSCEQTFKAVHAWTSNMCNSMRSNVTRTTFFEGGPTLSAKIGPGGWKFQSGDWNYQRTNIFVTVHRVWCTSCLYSQPHPLHME